MHKHDSLVNLELEENSEIKGYFSPFDVDAPEQTNDGFRNARLRFSMFSL